MKNIALGAVMACVLVSTAAAQTAAPAPAAIAPAASPVVTPVQAIAPAASLPSQMTLPANTEVLLSMNEELSTKGGKIEVGTKFRLSVVQDVKLNGYIIIPRGTPAIGEVTWKTGKGMFGKSGKMEIDLRHLDLNGQVIPLTGHYRQEGSGNTVATVATVLLVAPIAGMLVTGRSAILPQGRELKAYLAESLPVALPARANLAPPVVAVQPAVVSMASAPAPATGVSTAAATSSTGSAGNK